MSDMTVSREDNTASRVIHKFGGLSAMAHILTEATGKKVWPSVVQGWRDRGVIPVRRQREVLAVAKAHNIALKPEDLLPDDGK